MQIADLGKDLAAHEQKHETWQAEIRAMVIRIGIGVVLGILGIVGQWAHMLFTHH